MVYEDLHDRFYSTLGAWNMSRCQACGLLWLDPVPLEDDIHLAYGTYYTHSRSEPQGIRRIYAAVTDYHVRRRLGYPSTARPTTRVMARVLSLLHPGGDAELSRQALYLRKGEGDPLLLEVGCGSGEWLTYMRGLGWRVEGVELDPKAVETALSHGLKVRRGRLSDQRYPDEYADVICLVHVIEHLHDPLGTLKECRRVLKRNGRLVIATPNSASLGHRLFRSNWESLDPPRHLMIFDPSTMRRLLHQAGFDVDWLTTTARGARSTWTVGRHLERQSQWNPAAGPPSVGRHVTAIPFQLWQRIVISSGRQVGEELVVHARRRPAHLAGDLRPT
jgi:SAM-dependent methyltransferase